MKSAKEMVQDESNGHMLYGHQCVFLMEKYERESHHALIEKEKDLRATIEHLKNERISLLDELMKWKIEAQKYMDQQ